MLLIGMFPVRIVKVNLLSIHIFSFPDSVPQMVLHRLEFLLGILPHNMPVGTVIPAVSRQIGGKIVLGCPCDDVGSLPLQSEVKGSIAALLEPQ